MHIFMQLDRNKTTNSRELHPLSTLRYAYASNTQYAPVLT